MGVMEKALHIKFMNYIKETAYTVLRSKKKEATVI